MMTLTFTSNERFDRLVAELGTEPSTVRHESEPEAARIGAALMRYGIAPQAVRDDLLGDGGEPLQRAAVLENDAFDALVEAIGAAQSQPMRHGSRIVVSLFGFAIVPRRVTVASANRRQSSSTA